MQVKTMEGLAGARTNMNLVNTPMRVFKEARRKGDTATMERAMGYFSEFAEKAEEYKTEAGEGMEEDAAEAKERADIELEKMIEKRREESEKLEEGLESGDIGTDTVELSEEGKALLKNSMDADTKDIENGNADITKKPVMYTKTGEAIV